MRFVLFMLLIQPVQGWANIATKITSGQNHICVSKSGKTRCAGESTFRYKDPKMQPYKVEGPKDELFDEVRKEVAQLVTGETQACALNTFGEMRCWQLKASPENSNATQETTEDQETKIEPVWIRHGLPQIVTDVKSMAMAPLSDDVCYINESDELHCFRHRRYLERSYGWQKLESQVTFLAMGGEEEVCVLDNENELLCAMTSTRGEKEFKVKSHGPVGQLSMGAYHNYYFEDGKWNFWRDSRFHSDYFITPDQRHPIYALEHAFSSSKNWQHLVLGGEHICAIDKEGLMNCWWGPKRRDEGLRLDETTSVPLDLGQVSELALGHEHVCAITTADNLRCWGSVVIDQSVDDWLDNPTFEKAPEPIQIKRGRLAPWFEFKYQLI
jgi:alpha-tubulin suppressor-like RCC1 family protein